VKGQTLIRIAIWLATVICVAMLFAPLAGDLIGRLGALKDSFGMQ